MYDNIVFRTFVKITHCDKAFLIKDYHHHHNKFTRCFSQIKMIKI